jgi:hypothetical protein
VIHRQSYAARFTRSDVVSQSVFSKVCGETWNVIVTGISNWESFLYSESRHGQMYILRTTLVLSMGDSEVTGAFEEQLTVERQMSMARLHQRRQDHRKMDRAYMASQASLLESIWSASGELWGCKRSRKQWDAETEQTNFAPINHRVARRDKGLVGADMELRKTDQLMAQRGLDGFALIFKWPHPRE